VRKIVFALTLAAAFLGGGATTVSAANEHLRVTAKSGAESQVCSHRGERDAKFSIAQRPANGTARLVVKSQVSGTGNPIRVAQLFYKAKPGFVGTDSLSYQRVNQNGSVDTFTLSVSVVP
jgi:type IV pilus biogenesis protein CpaD/CtpE